MWEIENCWMEGRVTWMEEKRECFVVTKMAEMKKRWMAVNMAWIERKMTSNTFRRTPQWNISRKTWS